MSAIQAYSKEIIALLVPVVAWAMSYFFRAKARVLLSIPHAFTFLVQEPLRDQDGTVISPTQTVNTRSIMISNTGRVTATKLELVFNWQPMCLNMWPIRHYEEHLEPDNRYTLIFDSLAPNERFGIELLAVNNNLPDLLTVRCDQCVAENIEMYPQPIAPAWKRRVALALVFAGMALVVYIVFVLFQFLILKTPFGLYDVAP